MRSIKDMNMTSFADNPDLEFYGTVNEDGTPHITVINSLYILDDKTLVWGEHCHGFSKVNQKKRPAIGILSLETGCRIRFIRAKYRCSENSGPVFEQFNNIPRFRYNPLGGYSPIHYLDIIDLGEDMPLAGSAEKSEKLKIIKDKVMPGDDPGAFSTLTRYYLESDKSFKVLAYIDKEGFPALVPLPHCMPTKANRVVFTLEPYIRDAALIAEGTPVAIYSIILDKKQSVLVNGEITYRNIDGEQIGIADIKQVYSPIMPKACIIYPRSRMPVIDDFEDVPYEYNV